MFAFIFIYISKRSHFIFSDPSGLNSRLLLAFTYFRSLSLSLCLLTQLAFSSFFALLLLIFLIYFIDVIYGGFFSFHSVKRRNFSVGINNDAVNGVNCDLGNCSSTLRCSAFAPKMIHIIAKNVCISVFSIDANVKVYLKVQAQRHKYI